jgi:hypothetical protein
LIELMTYVVPLPVMVKAEMLIVLLPGPVTNPAARHAVTPAPVELSHDFVVEPTVILRYEAACAVGDMLMTSRPTPKIVSSIFFMWDPPC